MIQYVVMYNPISVKTENENTNTLEFSYARFRDKRDAYIFYTNIDNRACGFFVRKWPDIFLSDDNCPKKVGGE